METFDFVLQYPLTIRAASEEEARLVAQDWLAGIAVPIYAAQGRMLTQAPVLISGPGRLVAAPEAADLARHTTHGMPQHRENDMAGNHKLTGLIGGRKIASTSNSGSVLAITFDDGSIMTVKTAGNMNHAQTGGTIKGVRQAGTTLSLDFEGGGSLDIQTAEATSSVMVRDKNHAMEYAD